MRERMILIVEDDEDSRESMRELVEAEGYAVAEAGHGREALDWLARGTEPCLILLDLMMPVMSGLEFLELLRRDPQHATTPVVLVSAWPNEAAHAERVQGFIQKPFDLRQLFDYIERYCGA